MRFRAQFEYVGGLRAWKWEVRWWDEEDGRWRPAPYAPGTPIHGWYGYCVRQERAIKRGLAVAYGYAADAHAASVIMEDFTMEPIEVAL